MNSIKNNLKILFRNCRYLYELYKNNEIPKRSIYSLKTNVKNFKNFDKESDKPKLILSSNYHKVTNSRIKEFNKIFNILKNFDIFFFNHKDRDKYMKQNWESHPIYSAYKKSIFHQMKSDIFRYCFLYQNGGYWLDFKSLILFDINDIMEGKEETLLIFSSEKINENYKLTSNDKLRDITEDKYLNNWILGSKKESKFFKELIDGISKDYVHCIGKEYEYPKRAILELTGPLKLTRLFYEYINKESNRLNEFSIINETKYKIFYMTDHGRDFKLLDNIFRKHYSSLRNKKILH